MKKFVFFDPEKNEHYFFDTLDEAKKVLFDIGWDEEGWNDDLSDFFVAEIKAVGDIEVTGRKEDYEKSGEEWPYHDNWESVGNARWKEVE